MLWMGCAALAAMTPLVGPQSGELLRHSRNALVSERPLNAMLAKDFTGVYSLPAAKSDVDLRKMSYYSVDWKGRRVRLSGLVALPRDGAPKGLVVFCHGTISEDRLTPSRYRGTNEDNEAKLAMLAFATGGYAVAMPDYLGQGDARGTHPYPLASMNAQSCIDIVQPARMVAQAEDVHVGRRNYVTGYSEGGAVAMWTVRKHAGFALAAPLAGPYDLTGILIPELLKPTGADLIGYGTRLYLAAYLGLSAKKCLGLDLDDYFAPSFASYIPKVFDRTTKTEDLLKKLSLKAVQLGAIGGIRKVVAARFLRVIEQKDASDPLYRALLENNCYDWEPTTKMYLVCAEKDKLVLPANTIRAMESMRDRGVGRNLLRHFVIPGDYNHATAMPPSLALARRFFDGGFAGVPSD